MHRIASSLGMVLAIGLAFITPASAASELISIPIEQVVYGDPGEEILVASADVPSKLVGMTCAMVGETYNQESTHPGNDLLIRLGAQTTVVENYEDEENILREFRTIEEMPEVIEVFVRLGPDGVSSGGFLISIDCEVEPPPSTSSPTTTTIAGPSTTVTVPSSSVPATTVPDTTVPSSSVPDTTVPSSSVPETTVPSTSEGPTTTSVFGPPTESSVPPSTTLAPEVPSELAFTGLGGVGLALLGITLLGGGGMLMFVGQRRLTGRGSD